MALQTIQVPEAYKYVLDRGMFEYSRALSNVSFMLDKHINDKDDSFMDDPLYVRLKERALETIVQRDEFLRGTIYNLFDEGQEPKMYWCDDDNKTINYYPRESTEWAED